MRFMWARGYNIRISLKTIRRRRSSGTRLMWRILFSITCNTQAGICNGFIAHKKLGVLTALESAEHPLAPSYGTPCDTCTLHPVQSYFPARRYNLYTTHLPRRLLPLKYRFRQWFVWYTYCLQQIQLLIMNSTNWARRFHIPRYVNILTWSTITLMF